jgi:hypothetical protein
MCGFGKLCNVPKLLYRPVISRIFLGLYPWTPINKDQEGRRGGKEGKGRGYHTYFHFWNLAGLNLSS